MEETTRTTLFNNVGVRFYNAGLYNEAGELFRAALEETLLFADPDETRDTSTVRRAEDYVNNMNDLIPKSPSSNCGTATEASTKKTQESSPYFYNHPILLDPDSVKTSLQLTGAIIVNNLALAHHL